ncbi:MAG: twin-arginine translocase subunit TatC [Phycisphaerales bacterium]|nr:twin-arginine translocase subunit TatC [Phycisphaerales bacterium]
MPPRAAQHPDEYTMSFGEHLDDLRKRVFLAILAPVPLSIVMFFVSETLIEWLLRPLYAVLAANALPQQVQALSPPEVLMTQFKLSIIAGIILSAPWILFQIWLFVSPGLYIHERRFVYFLLPGSALMTVLGVLLMYFAMLPLMLHVLVLFGSSMQMDTTVPTSSGTSIVAPDTTHPVADVRWTDPESPRPGQWWVKMPERSLRIAVAPIAPAPAAAGVPAPSENVSGAGELIILNVHLESGSAISQLFRLSDYIGFVLMLMLGIVIAFQLPLVILLAGWLGLAEPGWLKSQRKYALIVCAVVSAVITPADATSMMMMLVPLYALYELGILLLILAPASSVASGRFGRRNAASRTGRSAQTSGPDARPAPPGTVRQGPPEPTDTKDDGGGTGDA